MMKGSPMTFHLDNTEAMQLFLQDCWTEEEAFAKYPETQMIILVEIFLINVSSRWYVERKKYYGFFSIVNSAR